MRPILFKIGAFTFPAYTFMIMLGVLTAVYFGVKLCERRRLPVIYAIDMAILAIVFGFLGGRIAHVLIEAPHYYWEDWRRVFYIWQGGFVSFGGHIAIWLSWFFYLRWRKQPIWAYLDVAAPALLLADGIGRTGCLLTGCCFGKPTNFFLHLTFTNPASTAYQFYPNTPLHATQIYLMVNGLLLAAVLLLLSRKKNLFEGELFSTGLGLYAVGRFLIEFLRGDVDRGVYFGGLISSGQIAMVAYFAAAVILYFVLKKRHEKSVA